MQLVTALVFFVGCTSSGTSDPEPASPPEAPVQQAEPADGPALLASGTVTAPADAPEARAVYVSLRVPDKPGPPLAAKRFPPGPFPLEFSLTEADRPMRSTPIPDEVQLKVSLDIDGDPIVKSDGDLESVTIVAKGATGLEVALAPE